MPGFISTIIASSALVGTAFCIFRNRQLFQRYIELRIRHEAQQRELTHLRFQFRRRAHIRELRFQHHFDDGGTLFSGWNTGFFSVCTTLLWEISSLRQKEIHPKKLSFINGFENYRDPQHIGIDIYPRLFREENDAPIPVSEQWRALDHHGHYRNQQIALYAALAKRWLSPAEQIVALEQQLVANLRLDPARTVAVVYRGTDKTTEVELAPPQLYRDLAEREIEKLEGGRVLIQTDQKQVRDLFLRSFGERCVFFREMPVTSGERVLHLLSRDEIGLGRLEFAQHLLAATLAISRCHHIINHTGNMALWICLFRGNTTGVTQIDAHGEVVESKFSDSI